MQRIIQVDNAIRALISRLQRKSRSARFRITTVDANRVVIETGSENSQSALTRAASSERWTTSPATIISVKHTLWNVRKKPAFFAGRLVTEQKARRALPTSPTFCRFWSSAKKLAGEAPKTTSTSALLVCGILWVSVAEESPLRPRKDDSISRFFVPLY
ncbi:hypothetical protein [Pseudomonas viridiflava]|uniref:hypothetical protein n=1 Tax=Pseudomonas viridiflava TaxID=33069 RepID=UPI001F141EF5|nr:hypothetical protein [Pseudomonas viridiflava]